jgi:hypothetical protein
MAWFRETECRHCGSKDHASDDCPHDHGFLGIGADTRCRHCRSKEHSSDDCPHDSGFVGIGAETECRHCGSPDHTSDDCPHDRGFFGIGEKTKCEYCGSRNHSSDNCPHDHGFLGIGAKTKCEYCGSRNHGSDDCPHDDLARERKRQAMEVRERERPQYDSTGSSDTTTASPGWEDNVLAFICLGLPAMVVLMLLLKLWSVSPPHPIRESVQSVSYVASEGLNLREGPGRHTSVVRVLPRGTRVNVLEEGQVVDGTVWVRVSVGWSDGWVSQRHLQSNHP